MSFPVLLDTNIIIAYIGGIIQLPRDRAFFVSVLTRFELLCYPGMGSVEEIQIKKFLISCEEINIDEHIAHKAAMLARVHRIGTIDLLIAATALKCHVPLITKNVKDFRRIPGLAVQEEV